MLDTCSKQGQEAIFQHRLDEIRRLVPVAQWRHCPGRGNPTDMPSRWLLFEELVDNNLWFLGPDWLCQPNASIEPGEMSEECIAELRAHSRKTVACKTNTGLSETVASEPSDALSDESSTNFHVCISTAGLKKIIDIERFSSLEHLLCVATYVLKFLGRFKEDDSLLL